MLAARAEEHGSALAFSQLDDGDVARTTSFAGLDATAGRIAAALAGRAPLGSRVILVATTPLEFVEGFFGLLYAGFVPVPAPTANSPAGALRLAAQVEDCGAVAVMSHRADGVRNSDLEVRGRELWDQHELVISDGYAVAAASPDGAALLQYTSGSTGTPRGVVVTHRAVLANERDIAAALGHDQSTVFASWLPPFHDMGLIGGILQPLFLGIPSYLMTPLQFIGDPSRWLRAIGRYGVTTTGGPNFAYDLCVDRIDADARADLDLSSWRVAFNGAEPIDARTLGRFARAFGCSGFDASRFVPCYGLAEATLFVAGARRDGPPVVRAVDAAPGAPPGPMPAGVEHASRGVHVSCGRVAHSMRVEIVDPETCRPRGQGEEGEIWIAGDSVASGYWGGKDADVFEARLEADCGAVFLRSGDLGFLAGGELFVTGRIKDLLIIQGRNVHPSDIEAAANTVRVQGRRRLTVAVERPGTRGDIALLVELPAGMAPEPPVAAQLRAAVAEGCGVHVALVAFVRGARLPRTTSGKVRRSECARRLASGGLGDVVVDVEHSDPVVATPISREHARSLLLDAFVSCGLPHPTIAALSLSPVDLGLDSLDATRLAIALTRSTPTSLGAGDVLGAPSLAALADRLLEGAGAQHVAQAATTPAPSPAAEAMAVLALRDPARSAENISLALELPEDLATSALRRAARGVVARHAALRTALRSTADGLVGVVVDDADPWCRPKDPSTSSVRAAVDAFAAAPFDLALAPLLRATVHEHDRKRILQLVFHHAAVDMWSLGYVVDDFWKLVDGEQLGPAAPPIRVAPVAHADEHRRYWRERFPIGAGLCNLPAPSAPVEGLAGRALALELKPGSADSVRDLARRLGVTPVAVTLAAYQATLSLYTGRRVVVTAVPFLNRDAATCDAIGACLTTLPVVTEIEAEETFVDLARRVHGQLVDLQQRQGVPFVSAGLGLGAGGTRSTATQFGFSPYGSHPRAAPGATALALKGHRRPVELGGRTLTPVPVEHFDPAADLLLSIAECDGCLLATLEYDGRHVFEGVAGAIADTWQSMLGQLVCVAGTIDRPLADVRAATGEVSLARGRDAPVEPPTAFALLEARQRSWSTRVAVMGAGGSMTYDELFTAAGQAAAALMDRGVMRGHRVAVEASGSPELVAVLLGIWRCGAVYCPIDPGYPPARREHIREILDPALVVTSPAQFCVAQGADVPPAQPVAPGDAAYIIFTSGSTGSPKGVVVAHGGIANTVVAQAVFDVEPGTRVLQAAALGFDASIFEIVLALGYGATLMFPAGPERDGAAIAWLIEHQRIDHAVLSPSVIASINPEGVRLQTLIAAGEALPPAVVGTWAQRTRMFNAYGPTECSIWTTLEPLDSPTAAPLIGMPISNVHVAVVDASMRPVPIWAPGELVIAGPGVALGYASVAEHPGSPFTTCAPLPGRVYRTGDLVRMHPGGRAEFLGREDRQIKVLGVRIELGEVEHALACSTGVARAVAMQCPRAYGEPALVAAVVPNDDAQFDPGALRAELHQRLPAAAVPVLLHALDVLPLDAHGKVDVPAVHAMLTTQLGASNGDCAPATATEQAIAELVEGVIGRRPTGPDSDLIVLGVHSLNAARLAGRLSDLVGRDVPVAAVFEHRSPRALARVVDRLAAQPPRAVAPAAAPVADGTPLGPMQRDLWLRAQMAPGDGAYAVPLAFVVRGPLDSAALAEALRRVVAAHSALRSRVIRVDGELRALALADASVDLEVDDVRSAPDPLAAAQAKLAAMAARVTQPDELGLLVAAALRTASDEHVVAIVAHHIFVDGWSSGVLAGDLSEAYAAAVAGRPWRTRPEMAPPSGLAGMDLMPWRELLRGIDMSPAYEPDDCGNAAAGVVEVDAEIPADAYRDLASRARDAGLSPFALAGAAFSVAAVRQQGRREIVLAVVSAQRDDPALRGVIGCLAATLPIRLAIRAEDRLIDVAAALVAGIEAAAALPAAGLSEIAAATGAPAAGTQSPLMAAAVIQNDPGFSRLRLPGLEVEPLRMAASAVQAGLLLEVTEVRDTMRLRLEANAAVFGVSRARHIVDAVVVELTRPAAAVVDGVSTGDQRRLAAFNATERDYDLDGSLADLVRRTADRLPDAVAVRACGKSWTYAEFDALVNRVANALVARGVGPGTAVGVSCHPGLGLLVAVHGVLRAGGAYVALDAGGPPARAAFAIDDLVVPPAISLIFGRCRG